MPRGRPRKNTSEAVIKKVDITKEETPTEVMGVEVKEKKKKATKELKAVCNCTLCNSPIYSSPYRVQLQNLTGKASWHRDTKVDTVCMCSKCANEFNAVVDKFIVKKNPSLSKWGQIEKREETASD